MKQVLYSSPYVPVEWVRAHGFEPVRFASTETWQHPRSPRTAEGRCAFATEFAAEIERGEYALAIAATTCDQMRHVPEIISSQTPTFLLNVPSTWQSGGSFKLYRGELQRLGTFLCRHGGTVPNDDALIDIMIDEETRRVQTVNLSRKEVIHPTIPIAITGSPLFNGGADLCSEVEKAGGVVVLDATESGELTQPPKFDRRRLKNEPFEVLAEAYFSIPDIGRRPNSQYYNFLNAEIPLRDVRGIIVHRHIWCDLWHAELHRIKEWAAVPVLDLGGGEPAEARTTTRIQAFLEMIRD